MLTPRWRAFLLWLLTGALLVAGLAALLEFLLHEFWPWLQDWNQAGLEVARQWSSPGVMRVMVALSRIGSFNGLAPATLLVILALVRLRHEREAAGFAVASGGAHGLNTLLKLWFQRPRPAVEWAYERYETFSFPSGHAVAAIAFFGMLAYVLLRVEAAKGSPSWARVVATWTGAALVALAIGASRVFLAVHYPGDVLSGFIVGGLWLFISVRATRALDRGAA